MHKYVSTHSHLPRSTQFYPLLTLLHHILRFCAASQGRFAYPEMCKDPTSQFSLLEKIRTEFSTGWDNPPPRPYCILRAYKSTRDKPIIIHYCFTLGMTRSCRGYGTGGSAMQIYPLARNVPQSHPETRPINVSNNKNIFPILTKTWLPKPRIIPPFSRPSPGLKQGRKPAAIHRCLRADFLTAINFYYQNRPRVGPNAHFNWLKPTYCNIQSGLHR